jgi:hypothetical protein
MRSVFFYFVFGFALLLSLSACEKDPGPGGLASISGKLYVYDYNAFGLLVDSGYVAGERIYISYGENTNVDDDVRTAADGSFKFEWLQKGKYTVWAISDCDTCPLKQTTVKQTVEITKRRENITISDLVIRL